MSHQIVLSSYFHICGFEQSIHIFVKIDNAGVVNPGVKIIGVDVQCVLGYNLGLEVK